MGEGADSMYYAYLKEDNDSINLVDNTGALSLIQDLGISEEDIFTDEGSREQLGKLLEVIGVDDYIIILSVVDLTDDAKELLAILKALQERQVTMISILEPFLSGKEYHAAMKGFVGIHKTFLERKRRQGYSEAKEAGIVGRPRQTEAIEKAIRLYNTRAFSVAEIEKLAGVSSSTLYRYLKIQET